MIKRILFVLLLLFAFTLPVNATEVTENKLHIYVFYSEDCIHCAASTSFVFCRLAGMRAFPEPMSIEATNKFLASFLLPSAFCLLKITYNPLL